MTKIDNRRIIFFHVLLQVILQVSLQLFVKLFKLAMLLAGLKVLVYDGLYVLLNGT